MPDSHNTLPRGIELLVKKAAVDADFRDALLADPIRAAGQIELELDPAESMMLRSIPADHLASIIENTKVPETHRRAFLQTTAASILAAAAAIGGLTAAAGTIPRVAGIRPDSAPPVPLEFSRKGIAGIVNDAAFTAFTKNVGKGASLSRDLGAGDKQLTRLANEINDVCATRISAAELTRLDTLDKVSDYVYLVILSQKAVTHRVCSANGYKPGDPRLQYAAKLSDIGIDKKKLAGLADGLNRACGIKVPAADYEKAKTLDDLLLLCGRAMDEKKNAPPKPAPAGIRPDTLPPSFGIRPEPNSRGIRPDRPRK